MVVVVPAFAKSEQSQPQAVFGFIKCFVSGFSKFVHDGVNGKRTMVQKHSAEEKSDQKSRHSCLREHSRNNIPASVATVNDRA